MSLGTVTLMSRPLRSLVSAVNAGMFAICPSLVVAGESVQVIRAGEAGFYEIRDSRVRPSADGALRVRLHRPGEASEGRIAVVAPVNAGEVFEFNVFLGFLDAGDSVSVGIDSQPGPGDMLEYKLTRAPAIPVSVFSEDAREAAGGWSLLAGVEAGSPAARRLALGDETKAAPAAFAPGRAVARLRVENGAAGEILACYRVAHSGYYALQDAWVSLGNGRARVRVYAGDANVPLRECLLETAGQKASLNCDVGYVPKGGVIYLAFSREGAAGGAELAFDLTLAEWAPRRAPLRVRRGADGLLDVFEPTAPRLALDIPESRWITVPAGGGDCTEAIRNALRHAGGSSRAPGAYAGVRLEAGKTYNVAGAQVGGRLFEIKGIDRLVFDGNGAILRVNSPELQRKGVDLFAASDSRRIVFADFIVEAGAPPFATGDIVSVSPASQGGRSVVFRLDPGSPDPVADIAGESSPAAYVYDPRHPGRMAFGVWSHYPGASPVRPAGEAGVFVHNVTRTSDSLPNEGKWLVKNKGAGITYLVTDGKSEDITLSGVDGRAPGGGLLRFWQTSGVNLLGCHLEPQGAQWISSTADGVHGRAREGVWIEDTVMRGICEDVMNTYGLNLVVLDDKASSDDSTVALRTFYPGRKTQDGEYALGGVDSGVVREGDPLVFFNPLTGRVLGRANVLAIKDGRYKLSNPVAGIERWRKGGDKTVTMVYSPRQAARFFIRDSRLMDGMRFGVFIKAQDSVIFNNQFEGLASPPIFASNEPEWPEGPMPANLWVQGNTFSQNNTGYTVLHRDFLTVDPAEISIYTRRLREAGAADDFRAHLVRAQYANSHIKIIGNVFHDWRGMGVAVRNARNVQVSGNLFLPPREDKQMRAVLAEDSRLSAPSAGTGSYAGLFFDTVGGVRVNHNRFVGLPAGDRPIVTGEDVRDFSENDNTTEAGINVTGPEVRLTFSEWFGEGGVDEIGGRKLELRGVRHVIGRLGAGLGFDGDGGTAVLAPTAEGVLTPSNQLSVALWLHPEAAPDAPGSILPTQIIYTQGNAACGVGWAINQKGRLCAAVWRGDQGSWLDLGMAVAGEWTHLALVYDGGSGTLRGFVDGLEVDSVSSAVRLPSDVSLAGLGAVFGGTSILPADLGKEAGLAVESAPYRGRLDEFLLFRRALAPGEIGDMALRTPSLDHTAVK